MLTPGAESGARSGSPEKTEELKEEEQTADDQGNLLNRPATMDPSASKEAAGSTALTEIGDEEPPSYGSKRYDIVDHVLD